MFFHKINLFLLAAFLIVTGLYFDKEGVYLGLTFYKLKTLEFEQKSKARCSLWFIDKHTKAFQQFLYRTKWKPGRPISFDDDFYNSSQ